MLRLLEVQPGHRVLDVGAGSGWSTALLAHLTGDTGSVRGVELEAELAVWGADNLRRADLPWASHPAQPPGRARPPGPRAVRPDPGVRRAEHPPR